MRDPLWRWWGRLGCRVWAGHLRCWHTSPGYRLGWLLGLTIVADRYSGTTIGAVLRAVLEVLFGTDLD